MSNPQHTTADTQADQRRWWALALLCGAFFMVILDANIVVVALPSIEKAAWATTGSTNGTRTSTEAAMLARSV